jgi:multiple inositol-polyphosphate phosphatase / 2,3-bisphosphoglycerate 3-phosphatase
MNQNEKHTLLYIIESKNDLINKIGKRIFIIGIVFILIFVLSACSDKNPDRSNSIKKDSSLSQTSSILGTKTPYKVTQTKVTPPPKGYKAVFVNYVGRHGARFLTDSKDISGIQKILSLAEKEGELTHKGIELKIMTQRFEEIENGKYGDITSSGKQEQEGIGKRIYENYKDVFKGNGFKVTTTQKVRTQQSARAFLKGLNNYSTNKINESILPDSLDDNLRFYDISPAYKKYKKGDEMRIHADSLINNPRTNKANQHLGEEFFKGDFQKRLMQKGISITYSKRKTTVYNISNFVDNLYSLYAIQFSIQKEIQEKGWTTNSVDFGSFFAPKDLGWLAFIDGAEDFLEKGPAEDTLGIQIRDAAPLLVNFIKSTDTYINHASSIDADLRFAHAETISPFATLLGIRIASDPSPSIFQYDKHWQAAKVIPLSANVQWILFRKQNHYLIKVLLNEKEAKLPIATDIYPFYDWNKVKEYYIKKLASIHVSLDENMHKYLLNLK